MTASILPQPCGAGFPSHLFPGLSPRELYSTPTMRLWQKPLLPRSAATCAKLSPDPYVPWTNTNGRRVLSQSASLTTTGHSAVVPPPSPGPPPPLSFPTAEEPFV